TLKSPSYTKSVSWQHYQKLRIYTLIFYSCVNASIFFLF
ncbi:transposase, partial [Shigella flexneri]